VNNDGKCYLKGSNSVAQGKTICGGADPAKIFFPFNSSNLPFFDPTINWDSKQALRTSHYDAPITNTYSKSNHVYYCRCRALRCLSPVVLRPKPFSRPKPAYFDFFSSTFTVHDHILSRAGDVLTSTGQEN
jgi:hypothetical protein